MSSDDRYEHETIAQRFVLHRLYKRGRIYYYTARDKKTGARIRSSTGLREKRAARDYAVRDLESRASRGREPNEVAYFDDAFSEWLALKNVRATTLAEYTSDFDRVYKPQFGHRLVGEIEPVEIERWLQAMAKRKKLKPRTLRKHLGQLRSFFRWCRDVRQLVVEDPTAGIRLPRSKRRRAGRALTLDEARALLEAVRGSQHMEVEGERRGKKKTWRQVSHPAPGLYLAILISLHTGLRRRNVLNLRWSQISLVERKISIPGDEMKAGLPHEAPIHRELLAELRRQAPAARSPKDRVLGAAPDRYDRPLERATRRAGIGHLRWHDLRHSFATWYGQRVPWQTLQALLAHEPSSVTLEYVHPPFEQLLAAVDAFPSLLGPEKSGAQTQGSQ